MNIRAFLISILLLLSTSSFSQSNSQKVDALVNNDAITKKEFSEILSLQFSRLVTGNTFSSFGNFASVRTTEESLSISASFLNKKGHVLSVEASGGATEGVAGFFNNGDLNSNISGQLTYHILINPFSNNTIKRNSFARDNLRDELKKGEDTYRAETIQIKHQKELLDVTDKINKGQIKQKTINDSLKAVSQLFNANPDSQKLKFKRDSLLYEVDKIELDLDLYRREKSKFEAEKYFDIQQEKTEQKYDSLIISNNKKVIEQGIEGIEIYWLSFGYGIRNDGFRLFDSSLEFTNQIQDEEALTHQFNASVSRYVWESFSSKDFYWSLGASYRSGHNLTSLQNLTVRDFQEISTNPNRESFSDRSVFSGNFEDNLNEVNIFLDYYKFFKVFDKSSFALHLNPSFLARENNKPTTSFRTGLVLPFKNTSNTSSFLNLEVFYSINDVFNTSNSDESLLGRNIIGLAATFPINFLKPKTE